MNKLKFEVGNYYTTKNISQNNENVMMKVLKENNESVSFKLIENGQIKQLDKIDLQYLNPIRKLNISPELLILIGFEEKKIDNNLSKNIFYKEYIHEKFPLRLIWIITNEGVLKNNFYLINIFENKVSEEIKTVKKLFIEIDKRIPETINWEKIIINL